MASAEYNILIEKAKAASSKAYAPYSKFAVGCALLSSSGQIYSACNVENISFGLTICAERAAIFKAISEEGPGFNIRRVVIYTSTKNPVTPCGACRQVLKEFGNDFEILCTCKSKKELLLSINELLPQSPAIILPSED